MTAIFFCRLSDWRVVKTIGEKLRIKYSPSTSRFHANAEALENVEEFIAASAVVEKDLAACRLIRKGAVGLYEFDFSAREANSFGRFDCAFIPARIGRGVDQDDSFFNVTDNNFGAKLVDKFVNQTFGAGRIEKNIAEPVLLKSVVVSREEFFRADDFIGNARRSRVKVNFVEHIQHGVDNGGRRVPFAGACVIEYVGLFVHNNLQNSFGDSAVGSDSGDEFGAIVLQAGVMSFSDDESGAACLVLGFNLPTFGGLSASGADKLHFALEGRVSFLPVVTAMNVVEKL